MTGFTRTEDSANGYNHHCRTCKGAVHARCFKQYHICRCEVCGNIFQSFSKTGCNDHTYANGYNLSAKKVKSGLPAHHRTEFERQQEANIIAEHMREAEAATEAKGAAQEQESRKDKGKKVEEKKRK